MIYTEEPPSSTNLRRMLIAPPRNITKKVKTTRETGMRNERATTRIALTSSLKKPTPSQGR